MYTFSKQTLTLSQGLQAHAKSLSTASPLLDIPELPLALTGSKCWRMHTCILPLTEQPDSTACRGAASHARNRHQHHQRPSPAWWRQPTHASQRDTPQPMNAHNPQKALFSLPPAHLPTKHNGDAPAAARSRDQSPYQDKGLRSPGPATVHPHAACRLRAVNSLSLHLGQRGLAGHPMTACIQAATLAAAHARSWGLCSLHTGRPKANLVALIWPGALQHAGWLLANNLRILVAIYLGGCTDS